MTLKRNLSSDKTAKFADRQRAAAQLRQLDFSLHREAPETGSIARVLGSYQGFEIFGQASRLLARSRTPVYSPSQMWLRLDDSEEWYSFNVGESDTGVIQSMDHQLRNLESRLEKTLSAHRELEHRRTMISEEIARGWDHALKYQELKDTLTALNDQLTLSGCEFEPSPVLSELDAEALKPAPAKVTVRQLVALPAAEVAADIGAPVNTTPADSQPEIIPNHLINRPEPIELEQTGSPASRKKPTKPGINGTSTRVNGDSNVHPAKFNDQTLENSGRKRSRKKEEDTSPTDENQGPAGQIRFDW